MNFLTHLWIADVTATSYAGAILGDVVRGSDLDAYPNEIATGIRLHRRIDAATDQHPVIIEARERFAHGARRYAGIVLDLVCDYVLAQTWRHHHQEPLDEFCARTAQAVATAAPWFDYAGGRAPSAADFQQLLLSYATPAGIDLALSRIAKRLRHPDQLLQAGRRWQDHADTLSPRLPVLLADLRQVMTNVTNPIP